jgi:DNA-binding beta-propeller fold protein YncE
MGRKIFVRLAVFLVSLAWLVAGEKSAQADSIILTGTIGTPGTGAGQLLNPTGVTVAPSGDIFVADFSNNRIQA